MKYLKNTILVLLLSIFIAFSSLRGLISALSSTTQSSSSTNSSSNAPGTGEALQIAPPLLYLTANPGQSIKAQIYIQDISKGRLVVTSTINDFTAKGETGVPQIFLKQSAPSPYSLKTYIAPISTLILNPKQIVPVSITINVPANASPGAHYGVVRFTAGPPSVTGSSGVALSASLGALVLLTVNGNIVEHLNLTSFNVQKNNTPGTFFQSGPLLFNEVLKNTGNEYVQPTGQLTVKDMFNHKIVVMDINRRQGNVLPSTSRLFSQNVNNTVIGNKRLFGKYTASIYLTYGNIKTPIKAQFSFWVIPVTQIIIALVVLIFGFFLIRYGIKRYNKYVISQAQKKK